MKIRRAVLTAAGRGQRTLPLQKVVDRDGRAKPVLRVLLDQALAAGAEEIAVVVRPGDERDFAEAAEEVAGRLAFIEQPEPLGYAHALHQSRAFVGKEPFLHLVGDHLIVPGSSGPEASHLVEIAMREECAVSGVQPTRERDLHRFGTVGGRRVPGRERLYEVNRVLEKPTPTQAEQELHVPGLRAGHYLCFHGLHVFTAGVMARLGQAIEAAQDPTLVQLSYVLDDVARHERYLAYEMRATRFDLGEQYGFLAAQLALGLAGRDREIVLDTVLEVLAQRERREHAASERTGEGSVDA